MGGMHLSALQVLRRVAEDDENGSVQRVLIVRRSMSAEQFAPDGCGGREKGVWGVERAVSHRSTIGHSRSACVTQEIGPDLGSRVLSR